MIERGNFILCFEDAPAHWTAEEHTFYGSGLKRTYPNPVILNLVHLDGCKW